MIATCKTFHFLYPHTLFLGFLFLSLFRKSKLVANSVDSVDSSKSSSYTKMNLVSVTFLNPEYYLDEFVNEVSICFDIAMIVSIGVADY